MSRHQVDSLDIVFDSSGIGGRKVWLDRTDKTRHHQLLLFFILPNLESTLTLRSLHA